MISKRIQQVQTPIIPTVAEWIRQNPGTLSLGQGVVYYGPPQTAVRKIEECLADPVNHKYHAVYGIPQLHEPIRAKLKCDNDIDLDARPELRVFVTAGANMGFMNAVLAIADPGDEFVILKPYYFNYEMAIAIANCRAVEIDTDEDYQPHPERIRNAITDRTRAVVTISPNNPTGAVYPEPVLREINALCRERGVYHIHDEAYEYFVYSDNGRPAHRSSPGSIEGSDDYTISLYSLSKSYGFAGWRIGYMIYPAHLEASIKKIQDTILICPPLVSQYAAAGALEAGADYCREKLKETLQVRRIILDELAEIADLCTVPPADGAFYFLLRIATDMRAAELAERLVREHRVAVIPGETFGMTDGCFLRVSYGPLQIDTAREGIGRLVEGLKTIVGGRSK